MSDNWRQVSKKILDKLERLEEEESKDRLDLVSSIQVALGGLDMSLQGWKQWVSHPHVMCRFDREDLEEMSEKLVEFTRSFLEYDLEATKLGMKRGLKARKKAKKKDKKKKGKPGAYVA